MPVLRVLLTLSVVLAVTAAPAAAQQASTSRVSLSSTGSQGDGTSDVGEISANGRLVVFDSLASTFVSDDTNPGYDVFLRDRVSGVTRRLNLTPAGAQADVGAVNPEISDDGRLVLFESSATDLVAPALPAGSTRLYLVDTATGTVRLLAQPPAGAGPIFGSTLSRDGRRFAFSASQAGISQVFAGDVATGVVQRVSQTAAGAAGDSASSEVALSGDGRFAAFTTAATNLTPNDTNGFRDIAVADLQSPGIERASVPSGATTQNANLHSSEASLSGDGCIVAFRSDAANLVTLPAGSTGTPVFVRDRCSQTTTVVSVDNGGVAREATGPSVSTDGCLIAFRGTGVSPAPSSGTAAILRDRCAGTTTRLDRTTADEPGAGAVVRLQLSGTGRYAVMSTTTALAPDDTNAIRDLYVRDRATNTRPTAALEVSADGRTVTAVAEGSSDADGPTLTGSIAWGDGAPDATGLRAAHTYARGGTFAVTVTVTDSDGATAVKTVPVALPDPVVVTPQPTPPTGPGPGTGPARPALRGAALSATRFKVTAKGKAPSRGRGSTLRFTLSAPATVRVRVDRAVAGRRKGRRCVAGRRTGRRCTRFRPAGSLSWALAAGPRTVAITGRFGRRSLKPGRYRLRVDASSAAGRSATTTLSFTVI